MHTADEDVLVDLIHRWEDSQKYGELSVDEFFAEDEIIRAKPELLAHLKDALDDIKCFDDLISYEKLPTIPGCEVLEQIGRGGMGIVYRAWQTRLEREVAVKQIIGGRVVDKNARARFFREAKLVAKLEHTNIVRLYEEGEVEEVPYFVMELLRGGTLQEYWDRNPQDPKKVAIQTAVIAEAVDYAHGRGVVHRDLKPSNVLLNENSTLKVADFGLAKARDDDSTLSRENPAGGTAGFMAPEQLTSTGNELSDVYSLGGILYRGITGQNPYNGSNAEIFAKLQAGVSPLSPRRIRPEINRDLETICLACLDHDPNNRYNSAKELANDLRLYDADAPINMRPAGNIEQVWKACKRSPKFASLIALVILLLVILATVSGVAYVQTSQALSDVKLAKAGTDTARELAETTVIDMNTELGLVASERKRISEAALWFANAAALSVDDKQRETANRVRFQTWKERIPQPVAALWDKKTRWTRLSSIHLGASCSFKENVP